MSHRIVDLSIDFDFFIREEYAWDFGHNEHRSPGLEDSLWRIRYAQYNLHDDTDPTTHADFLPSRLLEHLAAKGLRLLGTPDGPRFRQVTVANSHRHAAKWALGQKIAPDRLVSLDAHHDLWPIPRGGADCASWLTQVLLRRPSLAVDVIYPKWKDPELDGPPDVTSEQLRLLHWADWTLPETFVVRDLFLCHSTAWVPPHHDETFVALAKGLASLSHQPVRQIETMYSRLAPTAEEAEGWRTQHESFVQSLNQRSAT